jgi:hypothetical protein
MSDREGYRYEDRSYASNDSGFGLARDHQHHDRHFKLPSLALTLNGVFGRIRSDIPRSGYSMAILFTIDTPQLVHSLIDTFARSLIINAAHLATPCTTKHILRT